MYFGPLFCCILAVFDMGQHVLSGKKSASRTTLPKWGSKILGAWHFLVFAPSIPLFWSYPKSHQCILQAWGPREKKFLFGGIAPILGDVRFQKCQLCPQFSQNPLVRFLNNSACCKSGIIAIESKKIFKKFIEGNTFKLLSNF